MDFSNQLAEIVTRFVTEVTEATFGFLGELFATLAHGLRAR